MHRLQRRGDWQETEALMEREKRRKDDGELPVIDLRLGNGRPGFLREVASIVTAAPQPTPEPPRLLFCLPPPSLLLLLCLSPPSWEPKIKLSVSSESREGGPGEGGDRRQLKEGGGGRGGGKSLLYHPREGLPSSQGLYQFFFSSEGRTVFCLSNGGSGRKGEGPPSLFPFPVRTCNTIPSAAAASHPGW